MNDLENWTDEDLVPVFGDPGYDLHSLEMIARLRPRVQPSIRHRLRDAEEAAACEVEVWRLLYQGKNCFTANGPNSAEKWACGIAWRTAVSWGRIKRNQPGETLDFEQEHQPPGRELDPLETLMAAEENSQIHNALLELPAEQQAMLILARPGTTQGVGLGDLTLAEVAQLLGYRNLLAVQRRLQRLLDSLQHALGIIPR